MRELLSAEEAIDLLKNISPLGFRDPIDELFGSLSPHPSPNYKVEAHVAGRTSDAPSIAVTVRDTFRNDMWIVATDPSNIRPLIELIPTDEPCFLSLVDDYLDGNLNAGSLERALAPYVELESDGKRLDLHLSPKSRVDANEGVIEVTRLEPEHKPLFQSDNEWIMGQWDNHWLIET